ncbi:hypothetical protein D3H55_19855 [Bacillus salacetis]|uniref:SH3b domain-containing protein n=1 Tax=Bacillus salacetis TaxID=2315464 RepID=A0A3A1QPV9_9BACI|nr:glucosaminidase domain-containing protein [Bacillus salacetis]RIW29109.1 hypothetical protein D3H55_19855 [Bacillus salacetis]
MKIARKVFLLFVTALVMSIPFLTNVSISYAQEDLNTDVPDKGSPYYLIHYNGEEQEVAINEEVKLSLTGWLDEGKSTVSAVISYSSNQAKDITLEVSKELKVLEVIDEKFFYRIIVSETSSVENVTPLELEEHLTVIEKNENGTSLEEKITVDEYGTMITPKESVYFSTDKDNQKVEITAEEYNTLNAPVEKTNEETVVVNPTSTDQKPLSLQSSEVETEKSTIKSAALPSVEYSTHVQTYGWMPAVSNGEMSGTAGEAKRLEGIKISLKNAPNSGISYSTHVQSYGWLNNVKDGALSGTEGERKRLEAIRINLTGEMAKQYDIYYRVHAETYGWLDWAKNGQSAGTEALAKRLEGIEIVLVKKGGNTPGPTQRPLVIDPSVNYSTHVQGEGWVTSVSDGDISGAADEASRLEAIKISLKNTPYSGDIIYKAHVQKYGWLDNVKNGVLSGTLGEAKRLEAIQINLTGEMAQHYDVYYRVHAESYGWLGWTKNGQSAGTLGLAERLVGIQIKLVEKGGDAPGSTNRPLVIKPVVSYSSHVQGKGWLTSVSNGGTSGTLGEARRLEAFKVELKNTPYSGDITYKTHVQSYGWLDSVMNGAISGTDGEGKRIEAIQINLTGEMAAKYDIYYRTHSETYGWLGWAANGQSAGTEGLAKRVEAIQVVLVEKGGDAPGSRSQSLVTGPTVNYMTLVQGKGWLTSVSDGEMSGTLGEARRLEAIKISLENEPFSGSVSYTTHVQSYGWLDTVTNGALSGTDVEGKRIEAIQINLTGDMAEKYDIYYRVHAETYGWLGWAKNGQSAGTESLAKRLEAIEIVLVKKGGTAPGSTTNPFIRPKVIQTNSNYNITLNDALYMQMKSSAPAQTDKYRMDPAYVLGSGLQMFDGGSIVGTSVNLRTSPDLKTTGNIAANVGQGTAFLILDKNVTGDTFGGSTKWYKIEYDGKELYVHSTLASVNSRVGRVTADQLVIYSNKTVSSHVFGTVKKGTLLTVREEADGWNSVDIGNWRNAKAIDIQEYLNPVNFVNDEKRRLQFMNLTKQSDVSIETLNLFLSGKGILVNQGKAFIDAGKKYGINEVYLISHTLLETGHGTSTLAKGVKYNDKIVYNMYGIGAYDDCALICGAKRAYEEGWFTPYDAIVGGAAYISDNYLYGNNSSKIVQNTLYEMRWNPEYMATKGAAGHQYATDIGWAYKQVEIMYQVYQLEQYLIYLEIPVYK